MIGTYLDLDGRLAQCVALHEQLLADRMNLVARQCTRAVCAHISLILTLSRPSHEPKSRDVICAGPGRAAAVSRAARPAV